MPTKRIFLLVGIVGLALINIVGSCSKNAVSEAPTDANVLIELLGAESESEVADADFKNPEARAQSKGTGTVSPVDGMQEQTQVVTLDNNFELIATLKPITATPVPQQEAGGARASLSESKSALVRSPLPNGVKYRVLAYLDDNFVSQMDYEVGKAVSGFDKLKIGSTYTFIAYSVNSSANLPEVSNRSKLSTANFSSSEDLMYFRTSLKIADGDNYLGVVLRHQFSQITVTTRLTDDSRGDIVALNNVRFSGQRNSKAGPRKSGTIKLSDGTLTYHADTASARVEYPNLGGGLRTVTAKPTLLISPKTNAVDLILGNLLINAVINGKQVSTVRNNITLENFVIAPYQRYDLVLQIKNPCTEPTGDDTFEWRSQFGDVKTNTLYASNANYGYTFDIYELDNSFNMEINGQKLATKEIQFEYTTDSSRPKRNVRFADGTIWGSGNVSQIWNIIGNREYPSVKLVISSKGEVSLFGRKNNTDRALYPIVFTDDTKYNKINWNTSGQNKVVVTQSVINITVMHGRGYGVRVIPCP